MDRIKLFEALRDFFYYGTAEKMKQAYTAVSEQCGTCINPDSADWEQEEFLFNKLFVGPMAPAAPPVASVYLDPEGAVQGRVTRWVRDFYRSVGLSLHEEGARPDDCLEYELDACRYLLCMGEILPEALDTYRDFIKGHMSLWVGEFARRASEHCGGLSPVKDVLMLLSDFIDQEAAETVLSKELS